MSNILHYFQKITKDKEKKLIFYSMTGFLMLLIVISFFNKEFAVGLFLLLFLYVATIFTLYKAGIKDKNIYIVFLIAFIVHLGAVLFIYYSGFGFGGGADFTGYHQNAVDVSYRFKQGNFSLDGLGLINYYPVLIALVYTVTLPEVIIGNLFTVWLAALSVVMAYMMVLEIGGTKKAAFLASLIIIVYPSYLYFGSVLLKDTVVIPLVLTGLLLTVRIMKHFSWLKFLVFFIILTVLIHLRFYVGYAIMFTLIFSWPLLSQMRSKEKVKYWLAIILLLGFSPLFLGDGYFGLKHFSKFLNPGKITYFREVVYSVNSPLNSQPTTPQPTTSTSAPSQSTALEPEPPKQPLAGSGSTFILETGFNGGVFIFFKNSLQSFTYSLLGPFPWQFKYSRQIVGLAETIPWYILIVAWVYGCSRFIAKNGILRFLKFYKVSLPLLLFSVLALGVLSLFINNYGIIARIRIPMFICLISIMFISFNDYIENYYKKIYEKIPNHWRRWIYRIPFIRGTFKSGQ